MATAQTPTWVFVYFSVYATYCLWANIEDLKEKHWTKIATELSLNTALAIPAAIYWRLGFDSTPYWLVLTCYISGCTSLLFQTVRAQVNSFPDPSLSVAANIGLSLFGWLLVGAMTGPSIWWGWLWLTKVPYGAG
jgi:hypothetical protein